ncbi:MAG: hypothetical protein F4Z24_06380 [Nitrospira sp. SB0666_bin_27]|nr:hypothetical protein [Nitrospira sp. SB0666_bin_27]
MFVKKIALCVVLLCLASLFIGVHFAEAHLGTDTEEHALKEAEKNRKNALDSQKEWAKKYTAAKGVVDGLLSAWDDNEDAIKDGTWDTVNIFVATLISELIRHTNNDDGKSSTEKLIEALDAAKG